MNVLKSLLWVHFSISSGKHDTTRKSYLQAKSVFRANLNAWCTHLKIWDNLIKYQESDMCTQR